jgi:hypothetical protein
MEYVEYDLPVAPPTRTVVLTKEQRDEAEKFGRYKHEKSEREGRRADWYDGSESDHHADGVGGEYAHFLLFGGVGKFQPRIDNFKGADIGDNIEVRSTRQKWFGVKVKDRDKDERIVVGYRQLDNYTYVALGWLTVKDAKRLGEKKDPGNRGIPAYFVKDHQLRPIQELLDAQPKPAKTSMQEALEKAGLKP